MNKRQRSIWRPWLLCGILHGLIGCALLFGVLANLDWGAWQHGPHPNPYVFKGFVAAAFVWWFPASLVFFVANLFSRGDGFELILFAWCCLPQLLGAGFLEAKLWRKFTGGA